MLYEDLKQKAAETEAWAVESRIRSDELRKRRDVLAADLARETAELSDAEAVAASIRSEQAAARAEGRPVASVRKMPDVAGLRDAVATTRDAIALVDKNLALLEAETAKAESAAREALAKQSSFERGVFLLDLAPVVAAILAENQTGSDGVNRTTAANALAEAFKRGPREGAEIVVHRALELIFGYGAPETDVTHEYAGLLLNAGGVRLPVFGKPSVTALEALATVQPAPRAAQTPAVARTTNVVRAVRVAGA